MRQFLLVGQTGVGKSSFINATFGNYIAETSEFEACTKFVEHYAYKTPIGDVCLIDTPGLAEDDEACDEAYLSIVRNKVDLSQIYATIYVSRLDERRFRPNEKQTLRLLTKHLGVSIWNRSILVFTFAASLPEKQRGEVARQRAKQIVDYLQILTKERGADQPLFTSFQHYWMVDNIVNHWSQEGVPILSILSE
ncbi:MAG: GTPase [Scytonema sp. PMC 1069.18]|nr:GTPase [Scytonema sp. PMC 1069.18]MEC4887718.1 GTPase [Scytonema sp. PMC 1070.18]